MANKKSKYLYLIGLVAVLLLLLTPNVRSWINQQWMRIGLTKADVEKSEVELTSQGQEQQQVQAKLSSEDESLDAASAFARPSVWFVDSQGEKTDAANQSGKVVFINFWATWCPPCIAELPSINTLYLKYKDRSDMVFLIVDVDGKLVESGEFIQKKKLKLPVHIPQGDIPGDWLGNSIPTTVILDKKGQIAMRHEGMADYSSPEVFEFIDGLLTDKKEQ